MATHLSTRLSVYVMSMRTPWTSTSHPTTRPQRQLTTAQCITR